MDGHDRARRLFAEAKAHGLVNPVTGEGAPTIDQVAEELDCVRDSAEVDNLAVFCKRLVRQVRLKDPANPVANDCVKFLVSIGQIKPLRKP